MTSQAMRVALFNLIAYLPERKDTLERPSAIRELIKNIIPKLPLRALSIAVDAADEADLRIEHSIHILERASARINYDSYIIHAGAETLHTVPFALMPYLIPDLPIYLLWDEDPLSDGVVLPQLKQFATRLIFNSPAMASEHWKLFSQEMLSQLQNYQLEMIDINWAMIGGWRDALVRLFNSASTLDQLRNTTSISITYSGESSLEATQGIYLCSWLAAQLGWKLCQLDKNHHSIRVYYKNDGTEIPATLTAQPDHNVSGTIAQVTINAKDNISYTLQRHPQHHTVVVHIGREESCDLAFNLPLPSLEKSFSYLKELFHTASGSHYSNMLRQLALLP